MLISETFFPANLVIGAEKTKPNKTNLNNIKPAAYLREEASGDAPPPLQGSNIFLEKAFSVFAAYTAIGPRRFHFTFPPSFSLTVDHFYL